MFSLFRKKPSPVPLDDQLKALAECGVVLSPGARLEDLLLSDSQEEYEKVPFNALILVLGNEMERTPFAPLCRRLWQCDHERIEDDGAYAEVITRLHWMSDQILPLSNVTSHLDFEEKEAWVEFDLAEGRIHWDAEVDNDWLDFSIVIRFDSLLRENHSPVRLYANVTDFGQSSFLAGFTQSEFEHFQKLAPFKLREVGG